MNPPESRTAPVDTPEIAAGGLVWRCDDAGYKLAIVHRPGNHNDWVLPKGKVHKGEKVEDAAVREAMEETRERVWLERFAGDYSYIKKDGKPKKVSIWHMFRNPQPYEHPAAETEIDKVAWLYPEEVLVRLTYESERDFVARHCRHYQPPSLTEFFEPEPKHIRLHAAIHSTRLKLQAKISQPTPASQNWWAPSVHKALAIAEADLKRGDLHGGWGAVHDAERYLVFGMDDRELIARASRLKWETGKKLNGWRLSATDALLSPLKLPDWLKSNQPLTDPDRTQLRQAIVESLGVLNENSDNVYHRMDLVGQQLTQLVQVCAWLLGLSFAGALIWADADSPLRLGVLAPVCLAGALGGVVSAMYQLSRVGETKIPEALLHGKITSGRPLVGAASALFVYWVIQSNIINIVDPKKVTLLTALVLGFAAGFSERFVLKIVDKVAGSDNREPTGKRSGNPGGGGGSGGGGGGGSGGKPGDNDRDDGSNANPPKPDKSNDPKAKAGTPATNKTEPSQQSQTPVRPEGGQGS